MNHLTREAFQEFIDAVEILTHAVSSVAGTNAVEKVFDASEKLKARLSSDETIP